MKRILVITLLFPLLFLGTAAHAGFKVVKEEEPTKAAGVGTATTPTELNKQEKTDKPGTPALEKKIPDVWKVSAGASLRETLTDWTAKAGWVIYWGLPGQDDFRVETENVYPGEFKAAIHGLFDSLPAVVRIRAELRSDNSPPLLFITREEGSRQ